MAVLNFNKMKKEYLTVTFPDDNTIMVSTPSKAVMEELMEFKGTFSRLKEDSTDMGVINALYDMCAKVMTNNKGGVSITADYLSKQLDIMDLMTFFNSYMEYIDKIRGANAKN